MKKTLLYMLLPALLAAPAYLLAEIIDGEEADIYYKRAHSILLPEDFRVYTGPWGVINHNVSGATERTLPTANKFKEYPGCYIACYSRNQNGSVYSVGGGIYVKGQVRVKGKYLKRVCHPDGFKYRDISAMQRFKNICNRNITACDDCWAGGDTGGWFGIQADGSIRISDCSSSVKDDMSGENDDEILPPLPDVNLAGVKLSPLMKNGNVPAGAFQGGSEADGTPLYVARAEFRGGVYPAKLNRRHGKAYVSYNGREYGLRSYKVLTGSYRWRQFKLPVYDNAVKLGHDRDNSHFYVIRASVGGGMHIGRYDKNSGKARIPYGGGEINPSEFEILVER